jgi:hypothetical protein
LPIKIPTTEPMMMATIFRVVPNPGNIYTNLIMEIMPKARQ